MLTTIVTEGPAPTQAGPVVDSIAGTAPCLLAVGHALPHATFLVTAALLEVATPVAVGLRQAKWWVGRRVGQ